MNPDDQFRYQVRGTALADRGVAEMSAIQAEVAELEHNASRFEESVRASRRLFLKARIANAVTTLTALAASVDDGGSPMGGIAA